MDLYLRKERCRRVATVRQVSQQPYMLAENDRSVFTFDESQGHATDRSANNRLLSEIVTSTEFHGEARREFRVVPRTEVHP